MSSILPHPSPPRILPPQPSLPKSFSSANKLYISFPSPRLRRHCVASIHSRRYIRASSCSPSTSTQSGLPLHKPAGVSIFFSVIHMHGKRTRRFPVTGLSHTNSMFTRASFLTPLVGICGAFIITKIGILFLVASFVCCLDFVSWILDSGAGVISSIGVWRRVHAVLLMTFTD